MNEQIVKIKEKLISRGWTFEQPSYYCFKFYLLRHSIYFYADGEIDIVLPDGSSFIDLSVEYVLDYAGIQEAA